MSVRWFRMPMQPQLAAADLPALAATARRRDAATKHPSSFRVRLTPPRDDTTAPSVVADEDTVRPTRASRSPGTRCSESATFDESHRRYETASSAKPPAIFCMKTTEFENEKGISAFKTMHNVACAGATMAGSAAHPTSRARRTPNCCIAANTYMTYASNPLVFCDSKKLRRRISCHQEQVAGSSFFDCE